MNLEKTSYDFYVKYSICHSVCTAVSNSVWRDMVNTIRNTTVCWPADTFGDKFTEATSRGSVMRSVNNKLKQYNFKRKS